MVHNKKIFFFFFFKKESSDPDQCVPDPKFVMCDFLKTFYFIFGHAAWFMGF